MKAFRYAIVLLIVCLLATACSTATPTAGDEPPILPTANVPPLADVDAAIQRWEASRTDRYYSELEEHTQENTFKIRLVFADGQVRTAQKLEQDADGNWGEPVALTATEAQDYTVGAVLDRVHQDVAGDGPVPFNMKVVFDQGLGFPAVVHAEALPSTMEDGKIVLNRAYSYDLVMEVKVLLEDTFGINRQPMLTLTRSGGSQAWCDHLRLFPDGSSVYADDCRGVLLQLKLPDKQLNALQALQGSFAGLDDLRQEDGGTKRLIFMGSGAGSPAAETLEAAWEQANNAHALLSEQIGVGLTLLYVQDGRLYGFSVLDSVAQPARINPQGNLRGAAPRFDMKYLALSDDGGLKALDLDQGQVTQLLQKSEQGYHLPRSWSSSGRLLVGYIPESDADTLQLGWTSVEEIGWHALPTPEDGTQYGCDTGAAWSPDGEQLVVTGLGYGHPCNTSPGLVRIDLASGSAERIVAPAVASGIAGGDPLVAGAHTPAWSPDGQWIAFGLDQDATDALTFSTRLYRVRPDGSDLVPLTTNSRGAAAYPAWGPEGTLYYALEAAGAEADGIYRYNASDNTHQLLIAGAGLHLLGVSPDGEFLAYEQDGQLNLWGFIRQEVVPVSASTTGAAAIFSGWLFNK